MKSLLNYFNLLLELSKVRITVAVSFTTILGYVTAYGGFSWGVLLPTLGIFILACGSAALNQYQEYDKDALMPRTQKRPIPSGRISARGALWSAIGMIVVGSLMLYYSSNLVALELGLLALLWYNAIYTPLKKKTPYAVIPGAVIGALPPMVGWAAGGGAMDDIRIWIMAFFFFIWQIPHFWLLLMKYGGEYVGAGYPSLSTVYDEKQLRYVTFLWIFATAISLLFFPFFKVVQSPITAIAFLIVAGWLVFTSLSLVRQTGKDLRIRYHFININIFMLLGLILTIIDVVSI